MKPIICIAGPTASGKSALAVRIAKTVGGEVINADSMQVYSDIQVLSARPTEVDMEGVPHHLFGYVGAETRYSTGEWLRDVQPVILECLARDVVPILTGGTGLYFKTLNDGIAKIPHISRLARMRAYEIFTDQGIEGLRAKCMQVDPKATAKILGDDPQRLQRIYSVWYGSGHNLSEWQALTRPIVPKKVCYCGVMMPERQNLYNKINARFDDMVQLGGVTEAKRVLDTNPNYLPDYPMYKAIGLSHLLKFHKGEMSYDEAIELAKRDSRRLAKRQMTWFRNQTPDWPKLTNRAETEAFIASIPDHVT